MGTALEPLVERSHELAALKRALADAAAGRGGVALVYGEAGIGKTSLVRRACDESSAAVLWGACDALFTPRPLGPLLDMARAAGGELARTVAASATPYEVTLALGRHLATVAPVTVVFEDMHLADEATLDVLRLLARDLDGRRALVVVTYRDDAIDRWHPLRVVLGEVGTTARVSRLRLPALSPASVDLLAGASGVYAQDLYRRTAGNPFFVTEVLASGGDEVPEAVRDVVLGRAARLSAAARRLLDAIAIARPQAERWLLDALAGDDLAALGEACASGIVTAGDEGVAFRHELARIAIEEATPPHRRAALHRAALALLAQPPGREPDPARLAHHADALGDERLVLEHAPVAAAAASAVGAHREAATHYRRALRFAEHAPLAVRGRLASMCARELFLIVEFDEAVAVMRDAVRCFAELGDRRTEGAARSFLAQLLWQTGSLPEAFEAAEPLLALLEDTPGPELVDALCQLARLDLAAEDVAAAARHAGRAQRVAREIDHLPSRIMALQTEGWVEYLEGVPGGLEKLDDSLRMAADARIDVAVSAAYVIIVRTACRRREYDVAEPYLRAALEHCSVGDHDVWRYYLLSWQAKVDLAHGRWAEVGDVAKICLAKNCPFSRIHALVALGLLRARRGDPGAWEPLDEALALAAPRHELQWIAMVAGARAEAAWLEGRSPDAIAETDVAWELAQGTWWEASLAYWRRLAGSDDPTPDLGEEPYRLEMDGRWREAREAWRVLGCRYSTAFATLASSDEEALRAALAEFQELGAAPAARLATARLRALGARGVPRGPHQRTRENPAGLTARELEVLELVAEGMRNADIASRLFIAERTVDHHVSTILRKLGVSNRAQAASQSVRLGIGARS